MTCRVAAHQSLRRNAEHNFFAGQVERISVHSEARKNIFGGDTITTMDPNNITLATGLAQEDKRKTQLMTITRKAIPLMARVLKQVRAKATTDEDLLNALGEQDIMQLIRILSKVPVVETTKKDEDEVKLEPTKFTAWWQRVRNSITDYRVRAKADRGEDDKQAKNPGHVKNKPGQLADLLPEDFHDNPLQFYQQQLTLMTKDEAVDTMDWTLWQEKFKRFEAVRIDQTRKLLYVHVWKGATALIFKEYLQRRNASLDRLFENDKRQEFSWLGSRTAVYNDMALFKFYVDYNDIIYADTTPVEFFQYFPTLKKYLEENPFEQDFLRDQKSAEDPMDYYFNGFHLREQTLSGDKKRKFVDALEATFGWKKPKTVAEPPQEEAPKRAPTQAEIDAVLKRQREEMQQKFDQDRQQMIQEIKKQEDELEEKRKRLNEEAKKVEEERALAEHLAAQKAKQPLLAGRNNNAVEDLAEGMGGVKLREEEPEQIFWVNFKTLTTALNNDKLSIASLKKLINDNIDLIEDGIKKREDKQKWVSWLKRIRNKLHLEALAGIVNISTTAHKNISDRITEIATSEVEID
eukprot:TRINITY_DN4893_c0_g6_i1.p1 TRINITY_DN4893_c0_g6~~TRINITY_DN4893_c0_g6_i1.p1  ORF type:complete len:577 (+),score=95.89 TRINITY_DN4893_c0_g6_i1:32-1762(+)